MEEANLMDHVLARVLGAIRMFIFRRHNEEGKGRGLQHLAAIFLYVKSPLAIHG